MTIEIEPITVWMQGNKTIKFIEICLFAGYTFSETSGGYVVYKLKDENLNELIQENIVVPSNVVANWGEDDSVISDYILSELGFTAVI